jgi:apolipoprotein N-acyltransferase
VANYYQQPVVLGGLLLAGAWLVTMAPALAAFTLCYRVLARRFLCAGPLLAGAAWAASEWLRVLSGNPFGLLGYSQVGTPAAVQIAALTGVYGVSFLVVAVTAGLAEVILSLGSSGRPQPSALAGLGLSALAVAAAYAFGLAALAGERRHPETPATKVAIAQANLDLGSQWRQDFYGRNLEAYARLTLGALRADPAPLVVWPESAMTFFLEDEPLYRRAIGRLLAPFGAELIAGGPHAPSRERPIYFNSAFAIAPDGEVRARYDKELLLPFAEHFPLGGVELLRREFARVREFSRGSASAPLPTAAGPAGVVICNEAFFPRLVAERVRAGAAYLVNLTNDSWLGDDRFSMQALDMGRLRAIEQRRWLVRASTSGPSALVDPWGTVVQASPAFAPATLVGAIAARAERTPYARLGDLFAAACAALTLAATLAARRRDSAAGAPGRARTGGGGARGSRARRRAARGTSPRPSGAVPAPPPGATAASTPPPRS